jgi:ABC-type Na+ efflux pump permease subunit
MVVGKLLPALIVPLLLIVMVAIYTQFETNVDRTDWSTDANTSFTKVNTGTYNGFKLASLLPYVIIAMAILALIVGALAVGGGL